MSADMEIITKTREGVLTIPAQALIEKKDKTHVYVIEDGTAKAEGNTEIIGQLASTLVVFDPRFEIMPGTKGPAVPEDLNDFEYGPLDLRGE